MRRWRIGTGGCPHPRHDQPGVAYWGIYAVPADRLPRECAGRSWLWVVVRDLTVARHGWAHGADHSAQVAAYGVRMLGADVRARRCDYAARDALELITGGADAVPGGGGNRAA